MSAQQQPLNFSDDLVISSHVAHNASVLFFRCVPPAPPLPGLAIRQAFIELSRLVLNPTASDDSAADRSRAWASLVAGSVLGIIGWSGWSGFVWYFVAHAVVRLLSGNPSTSALRFSGC